jgi:glutathione S-transferase
MMILRYSAASPYARKILIAADLLGLSKMLTLEPANTADPNDLLRKQNPLGKIPTLILKWPLLDDSRVIVDYFDQLDGQGRLIPKEPFRRIEFAAIAGFGRRRQ